MDLRVTVTVWSTSKIWLYNVSIQFHLITTQHSLKASLNPLNTHWQTCWVLGSSRLPNSAYAELASLCQSGLPTIASGSLALWPWGPHVGCPFFSCWDVHAVVIEMCGLGSSVLWGLHPGHLGLCLPLYSGRCGCSFSPSLPSIFVDRHTHSEHNKIVCLCIYVFFSFISFQVLFVFCMCFFLQVQQLETYWVFQLVLCPFIVSVSQRFPSHCRSKGVIIVGFSLCIIVGSLSYNIRYWYWCDCCCGLGLPQ